MGFAHHEDSADLRSIDVKKLPTQYNGTCSIPTREQMFLLSVFLHDCRKKNHPFMTKQWPAGWTYFKSYADSTECI